MNIKLSNTGEAADEAPLTLEGNEAIDATLAQAADSTDANAEESEAEAPNGEPDSNVKAEERKYLSLVGGIGTQHGNGKKALVVLAQTITEGAGLQVIKPTAAKTFYKKFRSASDKKAVVEGGKVIGAEGNEGSWKVQVSKLNSFIKFGNGWREEASDVINKAITVHTGLLANPADKAALKLTSTYSALVSVAREHIKRLANDTLKGIPMDEEELRQFFLGDEPTPKTGADYVESAIKSLKTAQKGKAAKDDDENARAPVDDEGVEQAIITLREVLGRIAPEKLDAMIKAEEKAAEKAAAKALEGLTDDNEGEIEGEDAE